MTDFVLRENSVRCSDVVSGSVKHRKYRKIQKRWNKWDISNNSTNGHNWRWYFITACIRRMWKVLFSEVSVCLHLGGRVHQSQVLSQVSLLSRGVPPGQDSTGVPLPPRTEQQSEYLLRSERYASCGIPWEDFLVGVDFTYSVRPVEPARRCRLPDYAASSPPRHTDPASRASCNSYLQRQMQYCSRSASAISRTDEFNTFPY